MMFDLLNQELCAFVLNIALSSGKKSTNGVHGDATPKITRL